MDENEIQEIIQNPDAFLTKVRGFMKEGNLALINQSLAELDEAYGTISQDVAKLKVEALELSNEVSSIKMKAIERRMKAVEKEAQLKRISQTCNFARTTCTNLRFLP